MQTQSRLAASGGSSSGSASEDENKHEAVIRELTQRHELMAQLRAEALHALRGQGQAEATAAFILQEMSRSFTVCLSIMSLPTCAPSQSPPTMEMPAALAPRRSRKDSMRREQRRTYDGYQWRNNGQKRINKAQFPRCYYKCSFNRERNCRATKQVQQCSDGDPPQYVVMYFSEHTCDTAAWEPAAAAVVNSGMPLDDLSGLARHGQGARALLDERGVQEEHEHRLLVSSLASVLGGHHHRFQQSSPLGSATAAVAGRPGMMALARAARRGGGAPAWERLLAWCQQQHNAVGEPWSRVRWQEPARVRAPVTGFLACRACGRHGQGAFSFSVALSCSRTERHKHRRL